MTLFEILSLLLYLAVGAATAVFAGTRFGILAGILSFIGGIAILHGSLCLLSYVERMFWVGIPPRPRCGTGACGSDDYKTVAENNDIVDCCRCGKRYQKRGRRFMEMRPDGSVAPFMIWRAFKGWFPEE